MARAYNPYRALVNLHTDLYLLSETFGVLDSAGVDGNTVCCSCSDGLGSLKNP